MPISFRKNLIAAAALMAAGASFAQTTPTVAPSVTVYGRFDMALEANSDGSTSRTAIQNYSSRLGFKGEKTFNADMKGIFQLETGVAPDDTAQSKTLASRNSFVGLSSAALGSLIMGTNDMPLKSMEGTAYALWGEGDLQEMIIHGKGTWNTYGQSATGFGNVHTRQKNVLIYTSPKAADIVAKLAYSPDEAAKAPSGGVPAYSQNMVGASVYWDNGMFNAGYAYQSQENYAAPTATLSGYALTANKITFGAKMDAWSAGIAASTIDNNNNKKTTNWMVTGTYALGQTTLKASYGASSETSSGAADNLSAYSLEADYAMDKDFTVYTYYTQVNNGSNAKSAMYASDNFPGQSATTTVVGGSSPHALGLGVRYNF